MAVGTFIRLTALGVVVADPHAPQRAMATMTGKRTFDHHHPDVPTPTSSWPHGDVTQTAEYTAETAKAGGPDDASLEMLWHALGELRRLALT